MTPIERIQEMEAHLNAYQGLIEELEACLQRVEAGQSRYITLRDYYTSQVYMEDVDCPINQTFLKRSTVASYRKMPSTICWTSTTKRQWKC